MKKKRLHYPLTTASQRKRLFELWEEHGSVSQACLQVRVSRGTFYYWKARFEEKGYPGLEEFESRAVKEPHRISQEIEKQVIAMKEENPKWGKRRIAEELAKGNNWVPLVSPNTVRRILREAGLWPTEPEVKKKERQ